MRKVNHRRDRAPSEWGDRPGLAVLLTSLALAWALPVFASETSRGRPSSSRAESESADRLSQVEVDAWQIGTAPAADRVLRERSRQLLGDPARALRAAFDALEVGDRSHALWLLAEVSRRHPIVSDYADLLRVRVLVMDGKTEAAASLSHWALQRHAHSPVRGDLYDLLGDARADLDDDEGALAAWNAAIAEIASGDRRAGILVSIGAAQERLGLDAAAGKTYTRIWSHDPTGPEERVASHRLELIEDLLGHSLRGASDWRQRADTLFRKRANTDALAAYARALEIGLSSAGARRAGRRAAQTLFRLRRYEEAARAFAELGSGSDLPIWHARSLARAGRVAEAIEEFEKLAARKGSSLSYRARYLAALLLDGRGESDRAKAYYRQLARRRGHDGMADAARWRLGWTAYREGRWQQSIAWFDRLMQGAGHDPIGRLRPRYWRARSLAHLDEGRAADEFIAIARDFPLSYYGWRARPRAARTVDATDAAREVDVSPGRRALARRELDRVRILLAAGLQEPAREAIRELAGKARGVADRLDLAELATDAGDYHRAQRLVVDPYAEVLARGPAPKLEDLWWYAWPPAYSEIVRDATRESEGVEPELVYAIMREESGYRPTVVSPVGARGLLQIMSETGERLARATGLPGFHADDLFEPRTNIGLGSHYLIQLRQRFDGRISSVIASYNAGPEAVQSWTRRAGTDDDEWVEAIPYEQTRSYVKRVLRSLHAYRVLY